MGGQRLQQARIPRYRQAESIRDHPGFDKIVILAVSPQFLIATVTREELFRFLVHAQQSFVPLEKLFLGPITRVPLRPG